MADAKGWTVVDESAWTPVEEGPAAPANVRVLPPKGSETTRTDTNMVGFDHNKMADIASKLPYDWMRWAAGAAGSLGGTFLEALSAPEAVATGIAARGVPSAPAGPPRLPPTSYPPTPARDAARQLGVLLERAPGGGITGMARRTTGKVLQRIPGPKSFQDVPLATQMDHLPVGEGAPLPDPRIGGGPIASGKEAPPPFHELPTYLQMENMADPERVAPVGRVLQDGQPLIGRQPMPPPRYQDAKVIGGELQPAEGIDAANSLDDLFPSPKDHRAALASASPKIPPSIPPSEHFSIGNPNRGKAVPAAAQRESILQGLSDTGEPVAASPGARPPVSGTKSARFAEGTQGADELDAFRTALNDGEEPPLQIPGHGGNGTGGPVEPSPLQQPRVERGAERVGRAKRLSKQDVRNQTEPILGEAKGEASPIQPTTVTDTFADKLLAMGHGNPERIAYRDAAKDPKTRGTIEAMIRAYERAGIAVPFALLVRAKLLNQFSGGDSPD